MADDVNETSTKSDAIVEAADRLFKQFGYRRTAMNDIAREAGVAKGTLYLYFASKEALFRALLARNVEQGKRLCDAAEAQGGDLAGQIFGQLEAWFGTTLNQYGASGHMPELSAARTSVGGDVVDAADRAYEARLVRIIATAQSDGLAHLTRTGLNLHELVPILLAAVRGSKYNHGSAVAPDAFRISLRRIAHVFAAAICVP